MKEGKIGLDDKIEKYLGQEPWFSRLPNAKDITVRQLMNHTSGLVRYEFKEQFTKYLTANPEKVWTPEESIRLSVRREAAIRGRQGLGLFRYELHRAGNDHRKSDGQKVLRRSKQASA